MGVFKGRFFGGDGDEFSGRIIGRFYRSWLVELDVYDVVVNVYRAVDFGIIGYVLFDKVI